MYWIMSVVSRVGIWLLAIGVNCILNWCFSKYYILNWCLITHSISCNRWIFVEDTGLTDVCTYKDVHVS